MLKRLLPQGGLMLALEAWLDESGTDSRSPMTFVGGWVFTSENSTLFAEEWTAALPQECRPFHMGDLMKLSRRFSGLKRDEREPLLFKLISIIKKRVEFGVCVCVNNATFAEVANSDLVQDYVGSAYSLCAWECLHLIQDHLDTKRAFRGEIAYFFESGDRNQLQANSMLNRIASIPDLAKRYFYAAHAFVPKDKAPQLGAADMLAWSWQFAFKNRDETFSETSRALFAPPNGVVLREYTTLQEIWLQGLHNGSWNVRFRDDA